MKNFNLKYVKVLPGKIFLIATILTVLLSCEKFVAVDKLPDQLLAEQVFENDGTANSAIAGIYKNMRNSLPEHLSLNSSLASDDIKPYVNSLTQPYYNNILRSNDSTLPWGQLYGFIYSANNAIEQLSKSKGISQVSKKRFIAESKFARAFAYFYLVNLFGDVPLVLTTEITTNSSIPRTHTSEVYAQIIGDLKQAKADLPNDYSIANGEKVRANRWVATAMLARVYLYLKDYASAQAEATEIINSGVFSLLQSPIGIFDKNNSEAILQWANNNSESNTVASSFIYINSPGYVCTDFLLNAFENNDQRKTTWIKTKDYLSQQVSIPFKLTSRDTGPPEYETVIRLAEMYLVRAETSAMKDDYAACVADLNLLRLKHGGLNNSVPVPSNRDAALNLVLHERQVEFFAEGAHRWMDLKRTGKINALMALEKPLTWKPTAALYPIPLADVQRNPKLTQNPGYEN